MCVILPLLVIRLINEKLSTQGSNNVCVVKVNRQGFTVVHINWTSFYSYSKVIVKRAELVSKYRKQVTHQWNFRCQFGCTHQDKV